MAKRSRKAEERRTAPERLLECHFFIPVRRDKEIADGRAHPTRAWEWLAGRLYDLFSGSTLAPGLYKGTWKSPRTGQPISDQSRNYIVAVPEGQVGSLRELVAEARQMFAQQMVYLGIAGVVEFVEAPRHGRTS